MDHKCSGCNSTGGPASCPVHRSIVVQYEIKSLCEGCRILTAERNELKAQVEQAGNDAEAASNEARYLRDERDHFKAAWEALKAGETQRQECAHQPGVGPVMAPGESLSTVCVKCGVRLA